MLSVWTSETCTPHMTSVDGITSRVNYPTCSVASVWHIDIGSTPGAIYLVSADTKNTRDLWLHRQDNIRVGSRGENF